MFSSCVTVLLRQLCSWSIKSPIPKAVPSLPGWLQLLTEWKVLRWWRSLPVRSTLIHPHISIVFSSYEQQYNLCILSRCLKSGGGQVAFVCHDAIPGEQYLLPKPKILFTVIKLLKILVMARGYDSKVADFLFDFLSEWETGLPAVVHGRQ